MSDILVPKGQDPDRVQRRLEKYRNRHDESIPRFEHTLNGINEQQKQETLLLRQRFLEPKAKKSNKKNDKKNMQIPAESPSTTAAITTPGSKVPKRERQCDEIDLADHQNKNGPENYEPPTKVAHCNGGPSPSPTNKKMTKGESSSGMTKFPPEIIHQGKNGSNPKSVPNLKQNAKGSPAPTPTAAQYPVPNTLNIYLKQESKHISAFADLDQCAAALEKDGATSMGLIEGSSDGLIPSDTLKDLISEISDLNPDFMGDFDFGEDRHPQSTNQPLFPSHPHTLPVAPVTPSSFTSSPRQVKMEGGGEYSNAGESTRGLSNCAGPSPAAASTASPLSHPSQTPPYASGIFETSSSPSGANHPTSGSSTPNPTYCPQTTTPPTGTKPIRIPYISPTGMGHDSPAAQTLKQMAQHHQHKQLEIAGNFKGQPSQSHPSPARSPFTGDSYSSFSGGEFGPQGQPAFANVRNHSGDGVMIKQETPCPGVYGACPPNLNYPTSPMEMNVPGRRSKSPASMGHSKSFTQAHLNLQLPPSYRRSFSPPTSFNPSHQQIFTQHKMNPSPQMTLQHQHNPGPGPGPGHQQVTGAGQQMGMGIGQETKGGLPMAHHHHSGHYYQQNMSMDGSFPGGLQDQGQTINFTQQHLRMSQSGHPQQQQQPMGRMMGVSPPAHQPPANQMDRSRLPRLPSGGGVEMSGMGPRVPMEVQHRMMIRDSMSGAQGNEMIGRFNPGSSSGPGRPPHPQVVAHRQQTMGNSVYHHHQQVVPQQHMGIPPRRLVPYQPPPQENRISNQNQHQDNWHHHPQDHARGFHNQQRPPNQQQHFHQMGMSQQQNLSFPQHHHLGQASYQQHQNFRMNHSRGDGKNEGPADEIGLVLKTEVESAEFNLDLLEGMGDDFSFDPSSNYQNILDSF